MYAPYLINYQAALTTLASCQRQNSDFRLFLERAHTNTALRGLNLIGFLILPVQRIPRQERALSAARRFPRGRDGQEGGSSAGAANGKANRGEKGEYADARLVRHGARTLAVTARGGWGRRYSRYRMLLQAIQNATLPGHPDYDDSVAALARIAQVADDVNDSIREAETMQRVR